MSKNHEIYMRRCFDLARLGVGKVSPNPLVGAVIVHDDRIIGEGWHAKYGEAHAEVNAVRSVKIEDRHLLKESTIYVSLEPCCIFGKTPPCSNLIIEQQIPRVVISSLDSTPGVAGNSVKILRTAGVEVIVGILAEAGKALSNVRNTFVVAERPYIILKWAQSIDGFIGKEKEQIWLTQSLTKRLVHKWRAESSAILVGTNTVLSDDPELNNRLYFGNSPLRIALDRRGRIMKDVKLLNGKVPTWVISEQPRPIHLSEKVEWIVLKFDEKLLDKLLRLLFEAKKNTLIVEGGSALLHSFIALNLWDEARVWTAPTLLKSGLSAPAITGERHKKSHLGKDELQIFHRQNL